MIQKVLVVSSAGLSIFYHNFTESVVNPQLVAGFTTAINNFSEQIINHSQNIESLEMSSLKMRIASFLSGSVHLIIIHNHYDEDAMIDQIIFDLQLQFIEMFGQLEIYEFAEISRFFPFQDVVEKLCKTRIDIGILTDQSEIKQTIWQTIFQDKNLLEHSQEWNVFEFPSDKYPHVAISLWNFDFEAFRNSLPILLQKNIIFLVIEPEFDRILGLIAKISTIRAQNSHIQIFGLYFGSENLIKIFAETVLQIKIYSFPTVEGLTHDGIVDVIHETIVG